MQRCKGFLVSSWICHKFPQRSVCVWSRTHVYLVAATDRCLLQSPSLIWANLAAPSQIYSDQGFLCGTSNLSDFYQNPLRLFYSPFKYSAYVPCELIPALDQRFCKARKCVASRFERVLTSRTLPLFLLNHHDPFLIHAWARTLYPPPF